ncbi:hypothetical protein [Parafrankia sp. EUN1f]|uniref:hypothetical protein n=1 Tax=Parafrankia sp. EUN1f TaxID=102897 RepID=UPI0001C46D06|nr:hypothetical protein [Parafrankia sp. EUN1f]EFC80181.1 hypothetical protein FrEUN1fDRAFT_6710 [Parafrankia sp. EUN1f]
MPADVLPASDGNGGLVARYNQWVGLYGMDRRLDWSHPGYLTPAWALDDTVPPLGPPNIWDYVETGRRFATGWAWPLTRAEARETTFTLAGEQLADGFADHLASHVTSRLGRYAADERLIVRVGPRIWWYRDPYLNTLVCHAVALVEADRDDAPERWVTPPTVMPGMDT